MERQAVILAGGKGSRLGPYTTVLPKPLLPVGDRAILDVVVRQLSAAGFRDVVLAVGYLAHLVQAVFGDGSGHGVSIRYHHEQEPLGTAGPLAGMEELDETFLLMNGDLLTSLDYNSLFDAHSRSGNALTIATHRRVIKTEYGVLETDSAGAETARVVGYREKPEVAYTVSMGVYVADRRVVDLIPGDRHFDLPDVVLSLIDAGERVGSYLFDGFWLDIGRHDDYQQAIIEWDQLKPQLLPESAVARSASST